MKAIHDCEKEVKISFSSRKKLIQFVSRYLAYMYKKELDFWRQYFFEAPMQVLAVEMRIGIHAPRFERNIKKLLKKRLQHNTNIKITSESCILKKAFRMSGIERSPSCCFASNIEYEIKGLVFTTKYC